MCLGRTNDGQDKRQVWVMTIDRSYTDITFWEVKSHKHYVLKGRILKDVKESMQQYMCPVLTDEEKKAFQAQLQ